MNREEKTFENLFFPYTRRRNFFPSLERNFATSFYTVSVKNFLVDSQNRQTYAQHLSSFRFYEQYIMTSICKNNQNYLNACTDIHFLNCNSINSASKLAFLWHFKLELEKVGIFMTHLEEKPSEKDMLDSKESNFKVEKLFVVPGPNLLFVALG